MEKFCGVILTRKTIFNIMNGFSFTISKHNNIMSTDSKLMNSFILKKSINFMSAMKSHLSYIYNLIYIMMSNSL